MTTTTRIEQGSDSGRYRIVSDVQMTPAEFRDADFFLLAIQMRRKVAADIFDSVDLSDSIIRTLTEDRIRMESGE